MAFPATASAERLRGFDARAGVAFRLDGRALTASLTRSAPPRVRRALRREVRFFCHSRDGRRGATVIAKFGGRSGTATVRFDRNVSRFAVTCGVERLSGDDIALVTIRSEPDFTG